MSCKYSQSDRVVHEAHGPGTITLVMGSGPCSYRVALDSGGSVIAVDADLSPEASGSGKSNLTIKKKQTGKKTPKKEPKKKPKKKPEKRPKKKSKKRP